MTTPPVSFHHLSDRDLLCEVTRLAACEREATARLIAGLAEVDARRLYLGEGCASLFTYCTSVLHLSEHAAYDRIEVARAARRFPVILAQLAAGAVTLTTIRLLAPHLTPENHATLLADARHRSRREVEQIVARLRPQPDVPSVVRKLPTPPRPDLAATMEAPASKRRTTDEGEAPRQTATTAGTSTPHGPAPAPTRRPVVAPLAPTRYKVSFTISAETYAKLQEAQALLRHTLPNGDPAVIFDRALTLLIAECARTKHAATNRPKPGRETAAGSRHIPAAVRRTVWDRDGGQCAFVSAGGRRCAERGFLEFHHRRPYAKGGEASVDNVELRCKRHNAYAAEHDFGSRWPTRVRETASVFATPAHTTRFETSAARELRQSVGMPQCGLDDIHPPSTRASP